jgi:hypothetical protein
MRLHGKNVIFTKFPLVPIFSIPCLQNFDWMCPNDSGTRSNRNNSDRLVKFFFFPRCNGPVGKFWGPLSRKRWGLQPGRTTRIEALQIDVVGESVAVAVLEKNLPRPLCNRPPGEGEGPAPKPTLPNDSGGPVTSPDRISNGYSRRCPRTGPSKKRHNGAPASVCKKTKSEVGLLVLLHTWRVRSRG